MRKVLPCSNGNASPACYRPDEWFPATVSMRAAQRFLVVLIMRPQDVVLTPNRSAVRGGRERIGKKGDHNVQRSHRMEFIKLF